MRRCIYGKVFDLFYLNKFPIVNFPVFHGINRKSRRQNNIAHTGRPNNRSRLMKAGFNIFDGKLLRRMIVSREGKCVEIVFEGAHHVSSIGNNVPEYFAAIY